MLSTVPNQVIRPLKWPVAVGSVLIVPAALLAAYDLFLVAKVAQWTPFILGVAGYLVLWWLFFGKESSGSLFSTFEHELTHAIFAWLTLHSVTGFRATWGSGGEIQYVGEGNWLITIAPYWVPTLALPLMLVVCLESSTGEWIQPAFGVAFAYHMTSTWRETHPYQTDLQKVGFPFCYSFLPGANLYTYSLVAAFGIGGATMVEQYHQFLIKRAELTSEWVVMAYEWVLTLF